MERRAATIPHWAPPTHAMQIFRYAEQGSIELLWISATNPAVSLPELARIRRILDKRGLFVVVQDLFLTETAELADVVLPAALLGREDRHVHERRPHRPPVRAGGRATRARRRADLDIFLDYARRMDFRDTDGAPLIKWSDPRERSRPGRSAPGPAVRLHGPHLRRAARRSGIQWPCTGGARRHRAALHRRPFQHRPGRTARPSATTSTTGAPVHRGRVPGQQPGGRAFLHAADYEPVARGARREHPLLLTTGRTVYHFHTRTKTGRAPELDAAAPESGSSSARATPRLGVERRRPRARRVGARRDRGAGAIGGIREGSSSCRSTTGTGTDPTARRRARRNELTITRVGPGLEAADLQGRRGARRTETTEA